MNCESEQLDGRATKKKVLYSFEMIEETHDLASLLPPPQQPPLDSFGLPFAA